MKSLVLALTLLLAITPAAAWNKHGYGTPSAPTLPLIGNLVVRLSASDITGLSNGASVASWTAAVGGQVFTDTTSDPPVYATNRINGLPSVQFNPSGSGVQTLCLSTDPGSTLELLLGYNGATPPSFNYTLAVVFRTLNSTSKGVVLASHLTSDTSPVEQGNELLLTTNGATVGPTETLQLWPYTGQTSFSTVAIISYGTPVGSGNTLMQMAINGGIMYPSGLGNQSGPGYSSPPVLSPNTPLCFATDDSNQFNGSVEVFDVYLWNAPLNPEQIMQFQHYVDYKYGQTDPWAGQAKYNVFFGDSYTAGAGALPGYSWPYLTAQALGLSYGQWMNLGIGGITTAGMDTLASAGVASGGGWIDPLPAYLGKTVVMSGYEWYNEALANPPPGPYNATQTFLNHRRLVNNLTIVWGSSNDYNVVDANRLSFDAALDTACASSPGTSVLNYPTVCSNMDAYVAIHNDPAIGCESPSSTAACNGLSASSYETNCSPTLSATCSTTPYYWAGDGLHLKGQSGASCGYCILSTSPPSGIAGDFLAAIEAVP